MKFSGVHKLASYLMVVAAFLALVLSGEIPTVAVVLGASGIAVSWFWEPPRVRPERWTTIWNALAVGAFGYTLLSAFSGGEWVISGADFLIFLLVAKLFTRRSSRDYLWIYVVTFLMLLAGTSLNAEITYALCFLGYVVFATWALILFHLRREMEDNFLLKHSDDSSSERVEVERILSSRRIVGGPFLASTAGLSLGIFVLAAVLFLLFPRIGFGLFFQRGKGHMYFAGFTDQKVELGRHGLIRNDDTVVMRVVVGDPRYQGPLAPELHWRGVAFDKYEGGAWSRDRGPRTRGEKGGRRLILGEAAARMEGGFRGGLRQEIYLDPIDSAALFGASTPLAFELVDMPEFATARFQDTSNDEVRVQHLAGIRYVVWSDSAPRDPAALGAAGDAIPGRYRAYLQLPDDLRDKITALAESIVAGKSGPHAKAEAVAAYLRKNYTYTLEMEGSEGVDPIVHFLFQRKRGHCEYFSTAMAVLLRAVGVATRNVDGFLGGEWNESGYIAVRHGDAHSWVEVWMDGVGWVTYDPTPPAPGALGRGGGGMFDRLRRMVDTVRFSWFKWVIEYDFGRQIGLLKAVGDLLGLGPDGRFESRSVSRWLRSHRAALGIGLAGVAALAGAIAWLRRRRRLGTADTGPGRAAKNPPVVQLWQRCARLLARRGFPRAPATTPREHAARLVDRQAPGAQAFTVLTEIYYGARYGEAAVDLDEARRLAAEVRGARPSPPSLPN